MITKAFTGMFNRVIAQYEALESAGMRIQTSAQRVSLTSRLKDLKSSLPSRLFGLIESSQTVLEYLLGIKGINTDSVDDVDVKNTKQPVNFSPNQHDDKNTKKRVRIQKTPSVKRAENYDNRTYRGGMRLEEGELDCRFSLTSGVWWEIGNRHKKKYEAFAATTCKFVDTTYQQNDYTFFLYMFERATRDWRNHKDNIDETIVDMLQNTGKGQYRKRAISIETLCRASGIDFSVLVDLGEYLNAWVGSCDDFSLTRAIVFTQLWKSIKSFVAR